MAARLFLRCIRLGLAAPGSPSGVLATSRAASSASVVSYPLKLSHVNENHDALYRESLLNPEGFWGDLGRSRLRWMKPFDQVQDCDMKEGRISWFGGGVLNITESCLDRHVEEDPDCVAFIWERDEPGEQRTITYRQLLEHTCQIANALKRQGVKKGDRVAIYMPVSPFLAASMLACARIGAIHSVIFAGFSASALKSRILDAQANTVITSDEAVRGGKTIPLKNIVDNAVNDCDCVKRVFVATRTGAKVPVYDRDIPLQEAMSVESTVCAPEPMSSEDVLYMLYTSGSTGKPKGIVHTGAGYLLHCMLAHELVFDYKPGDIYCSVADIGWVTGHSLIVYGPLANRATSVLFESIPVYPDPGRYWEMVQRLKINQFFTAPTALRLLLKSGDSYVKKYDRSSVRILACVGEPLNDEAWWWYHNVVGEGKCTVVDNWWQTETGCVMLAPRPASNNKIPKAGFPMRPFYGVDPVLVDKSGNVVEGTDVSGRLCIRKPWPGMARTIHGNHEKYLDTYFRPYPGMYFTGDGAYRDKDGDYKITGRVDDVINVKGHRIGTAEVESAMDHDPRVAESAVVGFPHDTFGEGIYAFVILKDGVTDAEEDILKSLKQLVKEQIGSFAVPQVFMLTPGLPKTRSGKIMRRILRKTASSQHEDLGDISTLADPSIVDFIVKKHSQLKKN